MTPLASRGDHPNSITFLRLILAALVIYSHAHLLGGFPAEGFWSWTGSSLILGTVGVQGFFVVSGALVATSWVRRERIGRFLWCRALRLGPAFWICLAATALVFGPLFHATGRSPGAAYFSLEPGPWGYVFHNLFRPRTQIAIGSLPAGVPWAGDWNGSLWTLFYEGACYLMVAVLGLAGLLGRWRRLGLGLLAGILALHTVWVLAPMLGREIPRVNRLFDTDGKLLGLYFCAGVIWALWPRLGEELRGRSWAGPLACALLLASWHWRFHGWLGPWVMPAALFWLADRLPLRRFENWVGGDYSYGIYLYGYPVLQLLAHFGVHRLGFVPFFMAAFAAAGLCAFASWHGIEKRALTLKSLQWPHSCTTS